ncbi:bile acid:sodium symporter [Paenibacillus sp. TRM 82003]|uniref:bile acid:sodium symporter family protein n=1 Tax=Kineococcus sp. TRM81007 TaxID=2925831 RepID=UPI001F57EA15|nr:bile acid:sodium symporter family protein [Kineococcus sp. TRM81007]MCI2238740.1 bile acid:sodium symporter [Kineococcus sp. TRM81007]MCI3924147.1 bile acid:sodium symporter [Paenibacillus sp. TRM 82003]
MTPVPRGGGPAAPGPAAVQRRPAAPRPRRVEPFVLAVLAAIAVAALLPAGGAVATGLSRGTTAGVALLFFVYGVRTEPAEALRGLRDWRLQGTIATATYVLFPLLGLLLALATGWFLDDGLVAGLLFLAALPSTVQSCVVFTAVAGGNVPGAVVSATTSNLAGIGLTPLLAALLLGSSGAGPDAAALGRIVLQLLVPFLAGLAAGRFLGGWVRRHRRSLSLLDRCVIVAVVYAAFSRGVRQGVWQQVHPAEVAVVLACAAVLLAAVLAAAWWAPRLWGAARPERVTAMFCGSNKSLVTGLPMATVLFDPHVVGLVALPVILYHPLQITVCSALAGRMAPGRP